MPKVDVIEKEVEIPDNVKVKFDGVHLTVEGEKGKMERDFKHPRVKMSSEDGKITVKCDMPNRAELGLTGTWIAHVENMMKGVTEGFNYKMRIIYSHFPVKTTVKGDQLIIENFLGERHPRRARILPDVTAKISGEMITLEGMNKEHVGQTAANIEKATLVKNYDPRVFQDGIYLVSRGE